MFGSDAIIQLMYVSLYRFLDRLAHAAGWLSWPAFLLIFTDGLSPYWWLGLVLFWWTWLGVTPPEDSDF